VPAGHPSVITVNLKNRFGVHVHKRGNSLLISFIKFFIFCNLSSMRSIPKKKIKTVPEGFHDWSQMNTRRSEKISYGKLVQHLNDCLNCNGDYIKMNICCIK
jgi:hypothetical protein